MMMARHSVASSQRPRAVGSLRSGTDTEEEGEGADEGGGRTATRHAVPLALPTQRQRRRQGPRLRQPQDAARAFPGSPARQAPGEAARHQESRPGPAPTMAPPSLAARALPLALHPLLAACAPEPPALLVQGTRLGPHSLRSHQLQQQQQQLAEASAAASQALQRKRKACHAGREGGATHSSLFAAGPQQERGHSEAKAERAGGAHRQPEQEQWQQQQPEPDAALPGL